MIHLLCPPSTRAGPPSRQADGPPGPGCEAATEIPGGAAPAQAGAPRPDGPATPSGGPRSRSPAAAGPGSSTARRPSRGPVSPAQGGTARAESNQPRWRDLSRCQGVARPSPRSRTGVRTGRDRHPPPLAPPGRRPPPPACGASQARTAAEARYAEYSGAGLPCSVGRRRALEPGWPRGDGCDARDPGGPGERALHPGCRGTP